jgi:hypothetical protein
MGMPFQTFHRIDKTALRNSDHHIYWVEVFPAIKTSCQICTRIRYGVKAVA